MVTSITLHGDEQTISAYIPCRTDAPERMRRLLILGVLAVVPGPANAKPPAIQCPGENTVEMRYCAEKSWEQSDALLRHKVGKRLMGRTNQGAVLCRLCPLQGRDDLPAFGGGVR